jgi:catechol 2,3-dioxygenase-like lactoylglutathione lyase family enzyme
MTKLSRIAPEIPVSDLRASIDYYEQKLGFRLPMQMPDGDYAIVERYDIAIHLFQDGKRSHSPVGVHIFTENLDELHAELRQRGAHALQEIMPQRDSAIPRTRRFVCAGAQGAASAWNRR